MAKNKKRSLQNLLYNSNFLMGFSFVMALVIWIAVTLNESPEIERTIKDVTVQIDSSVPNQLGYEIFGDDEFTVDVTVKGKRYLVGDNVLSAEDINVTAITSSVSTVGKHTLLLKATPKNSNAEYKIIDKSLDFIEVYFDVPKEVEMTISPDIVVEDKLLYSDEYISDKEVLSIDKVTIRGPATEINKVENVVARVVVEEPLRNTQSFPAELLITDIYGNSLKYLTVDSSDSNVTITIPIYKIADLPVNVEFKNSPTDYLKNTLGIVASPGSLKIAAQEDIIKAMSYASVGTIDFNNINAGKNTFTFNTDDIKNFKVLGGVGTVSVVVDASQMKRKTLNIKAKNILILNTAEGYSATLKESYIDNVTVIGPPSELKNITSDDIYAEVNLGGRTLSEGEQTVTAQVMIKNGKCWAYGNYKVQITVVEQ